jgi:CRISPR-associated protein, csn2 family
MKIRFSGLSKIIDLKKGHPFFVCVENHHLYARFIYSLLSKAGEESPEPYTLWNDNDERIQPKNCFLWVTDPFHLPFENKLLMGEVLNGIANSIDDGFETQEEFKDITRQLYKLFLLETYQYKGNYAISPDVDIHKILKLMSFSPDTSWDNNFLDELTNFIHIARDAALIQPIVFVGICSFLTVKEIELLLEEIKNSCLCVLFFENRIPCDAVYEEEHILLDLDFLES